MGQLQGMSKKTLWSRGEAGRAYWAMILPAFAVYIFIMAFPTILSVLLSVSNYDGGQLIGGDAKWGLTGFQQYERLFSDPYFWQALKNNLYIVGISIFGQIPIGFIFAYILYRRLVKAPGFWQGILYMPSIISVIVVGILWSVIFSPYGPLAEGVNNINRNTYTSIVQSAVDKSSDGLLSDKDYTLLIESADKKDVLSYGDSLAAQKQNLKAFVSDFVKDAKKPYNEARRIELKEALVNLLSPKYRADFLNQPDVAMIPVLFVILWLYFGYYMILFLANMQKIDTHVIEAAAIDGASERQVLWHVILPALSGIIATTAILAIAGSLRSFGIVWAMTGGGPARITQVLAIYAFDNAFRGAPNYPLANAISTMMIVFSLILIFVTRAVEKRFGGKE